MRGREEEEAGVPSSIYTSSQAERKLFSNTLPATSHHLLLHIHFALQQIRATLTQNDKMTVLS